MADYHFPIALLRGPDDDLSSLTLAWAQNSRGHGIINKQMGEFGGQPIHVLSQAEQSEWFDELDELVLKDIADNPLGDYAAWAAERVKREEEGGCGWDNPDGHIHWLKKARDVARRATLSSDSPLVWVPRIPWHRAFKDQTDRRDIAIRDFRVLCSLYSWLGKDHARVVRRSAIVKRAFGFWSDSHTEDMLQRRIRESYKQGFTHRMIRDSLERLERCGEIIRISPSETVTWYARGSSDPLLVVECIKSRYREQSASRSKSRAVRELWEKLKQEGTK